MLDGIGGSFVSFKLWGYGIKIMLLFLCIAIGVLVYWYRNKKVVCKSCNEEMNKSDVYCKNCGIKVNEDTTVVTIAASPKVRVLTILSVIVLLCTITVSIVGFTKTYNLNDLATGLYSGYHQNGNQKESMWQVQCNTALTSGTFNKTINASQKSHSLLVIQSSCQDGELVLHITQGDKEKSINISNTKGELKYDISQFIATEDIHLSVDHTVVKEVDFKIEWK